MKYARSITLLVRIAGSVKSVTSAREIAMSKWEMKENSDVSWWHCSRPGYWEGDDVYCSKCQNKLEDK